VDDIFGNIFVGVQLDGAVISTLKSWMPTYLREIEQQLGWTDSPIPDIRLWTTRNEFTQFPADQMPMCVVVSVGLTGAPTKEGDGTYSGQFSLAVGFAAAGRDADTSKALATIYGAAGRAILLHKSGLGGLAEGVQWEDESYDDLVTEDERVVRACYNIYRVDVDNIVTKGAGPATPTPPDPVNQPGSQWPTADTIVIDIEALGTP
jgi:hypothetical protein